MEQNWKPSKHLDDLFSQEMATHVATALEERVNEWHAGQRDAIRLATKIGDGQTQALAQKLDAEELKRLQAQSSRDVLDFLQGRKLQSPQPDPRDLVDVHFPLLPTPQSCRSSFGPYNRWGGVDGGGAGAGEINISSGSARNFGGKMVFGVAGAGHIWAGSGCWFTVGTTGQARLTATFMTNGAAALAAPLGFSSTHIRFFASVWGAAENRWVDRGGAGTDLANLFMWAVVSFDSSVTTVTVLFDALAGGSYYCAGGFNMWTTVAGLASGGANIANLMNPLTVCSPFP